MRAQQKLGRRLLRLVKHTGNKTRGTLRKLGSAAKKSTIQRYRAHGTMFVAVVVLFGLLAGGSAAYFIKKMASKTKPLATISSEEHQIPEITPADEPCAPTESYFVTTTGSDIALSREKFEGAKEVTRIPNKAEVVAGCLDGVWLTVIFGDFRGYVMSSQLSTTKPTDQPAETAANPTASSAKPKASAQTQTNGPSTPSNPGQALNITGINVNVNPTSSSLAPVFGCSQDFVFTATVTSTGTGQMAYQWERSDGVVHKSTVNISSSPTTLKYTWNVTQTSSGVIHLRSTSPNSVTSNDIGYAFVRLACL